MRVGNEEASKRVMGPMPERAARMASHALARPMPTGAMMPSTVTTTRRRLMVGRKGIGATAEWGGCGTRSFCRRAACGRGGRPILHRPAQRGSLLQVRADVIDRLLDCRDLLGVVVWNLGFEFLFQRHHELD